MNIGVIGTGNMGTILIEALLDSGASAPEHLYVTNRTKEKAARLQNVYPKLNVMQDESAVVDHADVFFICVKPLDIVRVLKHSASSITRDKLLVSITSPVSVKEIEAIVDCPVARAIPSITNRALSGVSLITFGKTCGAEDREKLLKIMEAISTPREIEEEITRAASDIVSCGPAFFTYLTERFIQAAQSQTDINYEQASNFVTEMLIGLGQLLDQKHYTLHALREKVNVKGGVTGVGLSVLKEETGDMFEHLFQKTHEKYAEDRSLIKRQFSEE